jgi:AraC family transcriptional regulator of adaptative response/methylated-DNA-[protein]-cysteine methyltransferase
MNFSVFDTPAGKMVAAANEAGLRLLYFYSDESVSTKSVRYPMMANAINRPNEIISQTISELTEYFEGRRKEFTVPLYLDGTDFQKMVWQQLINIPYGTTWSYQQLANELNMPSSTRVVANANGANKIAIIIPCHRVIGSNGKLTGYSGGLDKKQKLLEIERQKLNIELKIEDPIAIG